MLIFENINFLFRLLSSGKFKSTVDRKRKDSYLVSSVFSSVLLIGYLQKKCFNQNEKHLLNDYE